jgi:hypothetical protein
MSSAKETELSASIPILIGSNWIIWEAQMKAYLQTQGLWQLVMGNEDKPEELPSGRAGQTAHTATDTMPASDAIQAIPFPAAAELEARCKEKQDWDNKDDQAIGIITLKISHSLCTHIVNEAATTWEISPQCLPHQDQPRSSMIFLK